MKRSRAKKTSSTKTTYTTKPSLIVTSGVRAGSDVGGDPGGPGDRNGRSSKGE